MSENVLKKHVQLAHNDKIKENETAVYACHMCDFTVNRSEKLKTHMKNVHTHSCKKCDFDTFSEEKLENHVKTVHKEKVIEKGKSSETKFCHFWNNRGYCRSEGKCTFEHKESPYCKLKEKCDIYLCQYYHEDFSKMNALRRV